MERLIEEIKSQFDGYSATVDQLMDFDRIVLDFCITQIENLRDRLTKDFRVDNRYLLPEMTIQMLKNIRQHDSMRKEYQSIMNQCLVLLVAYFSTTISDLFTKSIRFTIKNSKTDIFPRNEDIKLSFEELQLYDFNLSENLGELLIKKKDISFQDMQSIARAFNSYFHIEIDKDKTVNNLIVALAARHSIVHYLASANERFLSQISGTVPRDLKNDIQLNDKIEFNAAEIQFIKQNMVDYIDSLCRLLKNKLG